GTAARIQGNRAAETRAQREFLAHYQTEMDKKRVEYLEHGPVLDEFKQEADGRTGGGADGEPKKN
ncbi:MAG TPA: hypothetical protein VK899_05115, partial [Gemmatimonadales bacterium]|nr:hypothetical protein [Gemmatimonadales bacterium]